MFVLMINIIEVAILSSLIAYVYCLWKITYILWRLHRWQRTVKAYGVSASTMIPITEKPLTTRITMPKHQTISAATQALNTTVIMK
jgi:hypothetical protein